MATTPHYHSYLLRLWRDHVGRHWRAALQCTATGEKQTIADLLTLVAFFAEQLSLDAEPGELARFAA